LFISYGTVSPSGDSDLLLKIFTKIACLETNTHEEGTSFFRADAGRVMGNNGIIKAGTLYLVSSNSTYVKPELKNNENYNYLNCSKSCIE